MSETFAETFKRLYGDEKEFISMDTKLVPSMIELMEVYFNKLNDTSLYKREEFIGNKLIPCIFEYSSNVLTEIGNKSCRGRRVSDPQKEINKNIKIIQKFEDMIYKYLDGKVIEHNIYIEDKEELRKERPTLVDFELEFYSNNAKKKNTIGDLLSTTKLLKSELENKIFDYFPRQRFYADDLIPKKEMKALLLQFAKEQNLKGYTLEIKEFIDSIQ